MLCCFQKQALYTNLYYNVLRNTSGVIFVHKKILNKFITKHNLPTDPKISCVVFCAVKMNNGQSPW